MGDDCIRIEGARENNLQAVDLELPQRRLSVLTGVSGSGKSSLAFDTLFAEGQRRYVESLSAYARQFLGQAERPRVDRIRGLSPTIAVAAHLATASPRSTVGTITELHDYLRVLFARLGVQFCPECAREVGRHDPERIQRELGQLPEGTRFSLLAPRARGQVGDLADLMQELFRAGYSRVRVDGELHEIDGRLRFAPRQPHDVDLVVDRLVVRPGREARVSDSVETALRAGDGELILAIPGEPDRRYSEHLRCDYCRRVFPDPSPANFSFNSPRGCCPECRGLGVVMRVDPARVVPDPELALSQGAIQATGFGSAGRQGWTHAALAAMAGRRGLDLDQPWRTLSEEERSLVLYGEPEARRAPGEERGRRSGPDKPWEGVIPTLERRMSATSSPGARQAYQDLLADGVCSACHGSRLRPESAAVRVGGHSLPELEAQPAAELRRRLADLRLEPWEQEIAQDLLQETLHRLQLLEELGIGYLSLDRSGPTLSGGEAQRIRLAGQLGGELSGVTYVLDEPSCGLHPADGERLVLALHELRDAGNTVVVVEHNEAIIRAADRVVEFGPGAGRAGGRVVAQGSPAELEASPASLTGAYLAGRRSIAPGPGQPSPPERWLHLRKCRGHNLRGLDLALPLGRLVTLTGVSGAGKSSLVAGTLYPALARRLQGAQAEPLPYESLAGAEDLDKVVWVDQRPIGRSSRSTAATYTGAYDLIRELFAGCEEARAFGFDARRFSFNTKGGRCETCKGEGWRRVEMHFLPDVRVRCEACEGQRFNQSTLRVRYRGMNIAQVLALPCEEAAAQFAAIPALARILDTLREVGLGYLELGQPASTLSGGEAQRVKLARELARTEQGRSLYLLDEPSRGLHPEDIARLLDVLERLVARGNTVVVVEHQLDVVARSDWVIDLGPGAGEQGGAIVFAGPPAQLAACDASVTGRYLAPCLARKAAR